MEPPESPIPRIPLLGVLPSEESFDSPIDRRSDYYRQQAWQHRTHGKASPAAPQRQPLLTLPNLLTLMRLVLVPVLVLLWDVQLPWVPVTCAALFVAASLTDWLDGYLARKVRGRAHVCRLRAARLCAVFVSALVDARARARTQGGCIDGDAGGSRRAAEPLCARFIAALQNARQGLTACNPPINKTPSPSSSLLHTIHCARAQLEIATAFGAFLDPVADKVMCVVFLG
jgi:hypothetical protein